ncbi:MAG: hypothetical protein J6V99_08870 [Neisseriaceae bacterium]|nr:hypothetical protein [Neisseriaceae bacterium]
MKPYITVIDNSVESIALQGGLRAVKYYPEWEEDPTKFDDYFANFSINAWDRRINRQDCELCNDWKPEMRDIYKGLTSIKECKMRLNNDNVLSEIDAQAIICYALYWQHQEQYKLNKTHHNAIMRSFGRLCKQYYFEPLGLYDHSGCVFYSGIRHGWDYSAVGFVAVERQKCDCTSDQECQAVITEALRAYNAYFNNEIASICIENADGEIIEEHGGFYDDDEINRFLSDSYGLLKEAA